MWLVVVTMTSGKYDEHRLTATADRHQDSKQSQILTFIHLVGYGDYYPSSHMGRFIIIGTTFWGVFLISMCIVSVGNYRNFYSTEKQVRDKNDSLF